MSVRVSVIIPIFRVEAYIERCARSLMEQTMQDGLEYIFVDDCSPDESMSVLQRILRDYPERGHLVKVLRHEHNKGLPAARNTGLAAATGEYIFHCDSDDYVERDALASMYEAAVRANADIVYTDWFLDISPSLTPPVGGRKSPSSGRTRYMRCPDYRTPEEALRGVLHGTMKYNVWNKLVKRSLYQSLHAVSTMGGDPEGAIPPPHGGIQRAAFPSGHGMGEDMTMILLFAKAQRIAYLPKGTYHYVRQNENAFTASRSEATATMYEDLYFNAQRVVNALTDSVPEGDLACFKLNVKFPFLISTRREDYDRWQQWFPEANRHIHSHHVSRRARLLERCADWHIYLPIRLHYHLLQRLQR